MSIAGRPLSHRRLRHRLARLTCAGAAFALLVVAAPSAADAPARAGSWADADHGWSLYTSDLGCRPRADLCATDDGGATWHGIFNGSVSEFERTSATAGVVSVGGDTVFWTRDAGRRWYRTTKVFGHYAGHGKLLFATSDTDLYQVGPWPPKRPVRCHGVWRAAARDDGTAGTARSSVCSGAAADAGLRPHLVATVAGSQIGDLASIPGGVAGVSDVRDDYGRLNAFVWRLGKLTQTQLPFPRAGWWCCGEVHAAWPAIFVTATIFAPPGSADEQLDVVWQSLDGGASWTTYVK